ncbi:MAG: transglutaminase-like domain-containing protein [Tepidisphaeraceae bacterium]
MKTALPLCCAPDAFNLLNRQVPAIESPDALVHGAAAIAMHQLDTVDVAEIDATLQRYADTVRSRVRGSQPQALLAHLHDVLFDEEQFKGNEDDYYNTSNSYLPEVLKTKRGLPITLSLIYKVVAERLGLRTWGIGLPGHFLCGVDVGGQIMLVDPFAQGRVVTVDEAHARMQEMLGPDVEWSDELLQPVSNRHWLTRMLQNLLHTFGNSGHFADVAAVLEMEMLLWPKREQLQRDLALVLARCGLSQPASIWLDRYLKNNPDDPQKNELSQLLDVLK